jgi:hypothetical protein
MYSEGLIGICHIEREGLIGRCHIEREVLIGRCGTDRVGLMQCVIQYIIRCIIELG